MPTWPLNTKEKKIPQSDAPGSFWEDRGDRHHCGIDLYTVSGSHVFAMENCTVIETGIMTSPQLIHYWNVTYYIIVKNKNGTFWKYGELEEIFVKSGDKIKEGQYIGKVGLVLNSSKISESSPLYIQKLKDKNPSMLHLEHFSENPIAQHEKYLGGNWFDTEMPKQLLNPAKFLELID